MVTIYTVLRVKCVSKLWFLGLALGFTYGFYGHYQLKKTTPKVCYKDKVCPIKKYPQFHTDLSSFTTVTLSYLFGYIISLDNHKMV